MTDLPCPGYADHYIRQRRCQRSYQPQGRQRCSEVKRSFSFSRTPTQAKTKLLGQHRWHTVTLLPAAYQLLLIFFSEYAASNPAAPVTFTLTTTTLLRKYTFLGDLPLTVLPFVSRIIGALSFPTSVADPNDGDRALVANTWRRYLLTRDAFAQHASQYTWDRHLYMIVSRYVWFNDLKRVERATEKADN